MKYLVKIDNLFSNIIEVEADGPESARENAKDFFENNKKYVRHLKDYYISTTPPEHWVIIEKDEFEEIENDFKKQLKIKEHVSILMHRASVIDHRNKIKHASSVAGIVERYILTKKLIEAEQKIDEQKISLDEKCREELDRIIAQNVKDDRGWLKYIDPSSSPHTIPQLKSELNHCKRLLDDGEYRKEFIEEGRKYRSNKKLEEKIKILSNQKVEKEKAEQKALENNTVYDELDEFVKSQKSEREKAKYTKPNKQNKRSK